MAIGLGNLGNIIEDFTNTLNQILGRTSNPAENEKGGSTDKLFDVKVGGSVLLEREKWLGNSKGKKVRYGFATLRLNDVRTFSGPGQTFFNPRTEEDAGPYFLDIPPQAITQKEIFANNITATRKGIIVETEGVVFKDIIIQGTTGVFPGQRGSATNPTPNFKDFTKPPQPARGVDPSSGKSKAPNVQTLSGYEEFLRLRQYFLKYAADKVRLDGDLFLIFINEKDNQTLIVEPLEFTMERSSRSPMTYNYKIILKAIGNLNAVFEGPGATAKERGGIIGFLEDVGNVAANVQATIQTGRAVVNASARLVQQISEAADQTFNGTLRQIEFATGDIADGLATVFSLPEILLRNATDTVLDIKENINEIGTTIYDAFGTSTDGFKVSTAGTTVSTTSKLEASSSEGRASQSADFVNQRAIADRIENDSRVSIPRSFIENAKEEVTEIANNLTDFVGLGDSSFDEIKGRVVTNPPDPLKVPNDDEILLLGSLQEITNGLNLTLSSNNMFASDAEDEFEASAAIFENEDIPEDRQIKITRPEFVKEITIMRGDTLERIAQREYNDPLRWLDLVVLNKLKPPYIDEAGGDGVRKPGETILVGE